MSLVGERLSPDPDRELDIPRDVEAELVGEFYDHHYRGWLDTPLPALGVRTPRAATADTPTRAEVIALLERPG